MLEQVIHILAEFTEVSEKHITAKSVLTADLGFSSLDVIQVVMAFEESFGIEIPDEEINNLISVSDIVHYLEEHM